MRYPAPLINISVTHYGLSASVASSQLTNRLSCSKNFLVFVNRSSTIHRANWPVQLIEKASNAYWTVADPGFPR